MTYRILILFLLFPFFSYGLPFSLISSFGDSGRAGKGSSEYHILNAATIIQGASQVAGFYSFDSNNTEYGVSVSNQKDLPVAITWARDSSQQHRIFSIAGSLNPRWVLGASIHYFSDQIINPHLGLLYIPFKKLRLGLTGDRIDNEFLYGFGFYYELSKIVNILGDVTYKQDQWTFHGGLEIVVQKIFSLRFGQLWPHSSYRAGISFIGFPIKVDYTWIQKKGHIFGIRIQSTDF